MFWQKNPGNGVWWMRLYNTAADTGHGFLNIGGTLRLRVRTAAGANVETATSPPLQDESWKHYAGTYDGSVGRFYLDGALIGTTGSASGPAAINRIDIAGHTLNNFAMDDVRIYDNVLSQSEIATLKDTPVIPEVGSNSRWRRGDGVELTPYLKTPSGLVEME
jgi:large repetitive protein